MYLHYLYGKGEALNLDNLGAKKLVSAVILKEGAFKRKGSIERRFLSTVAKRFGKNKTNYTFENNYNIGSEINIWAFGSGVIGGKFVGKINKLKSGDFSIVGTITYTFTDEFKDPYDTDDWVDGSWDPNGTPYKIKDTIIHKVNTLITTQEEKEAYDQ